MKKEFCTHDIALKLRDLGFDELCFGTFNFRGELYYYPIVNGLWKNSYVNLPENKEMLSDRIGAPLWQQAIEWISKKYKLDIEIMSSSINFYKDEIKQPKKFQFLIEDEEDLVYHSADYDLFYNNRYDARREAILKLFELV